MDIPDKRKVHSTSTPRLGGLAVFSSFAVSLTLLFFLFPDLSPTIISDVEDAFVNTIQAVLVVVAFLMVFAVGMRDDIKTLEPGPKFAVQFAAATLIYFAGFSITFVTNPAGPGVLNLQILSYPVTVLWIVGITNAFNLIDGLDGLASGVAAIALITIVSISLVHQQLGIAMIALILAGSIVGFLWFNFRPATIFLGDSGSLFIGFFLALLSIQSFTKASTTFAALIPIFALGLPILDTTLSMLRRLFSWFLPEREQASRDVTFRKVARSIFSPDKSHIHHQLINRGLSHKNTVLVLYMVSALFCMGAFMVSVTEQVDQTMLIILFSLVAVKVGINRLSYEEINLLQNGIFFTLYNYFIINKRYFRKVLDALFVVVAYLGSYYLIYPDDFVALATKQPLQATLVVLTVLGVQAGTFRLAGLYRKTIRRLGIADVVKILQLVTLAVFLTAIVQRIFFSGLLNTTLLLFVIDFYLLITCVLGLRISFHALRHLFYKSRRNQQRILVYGAGEQGVLALRQLMTLDPQQYTPVGFIDEDPELEGKLVHGYPVYGGHWKLERLIKSQNIDKLLISDYNMHPKIIRKIHSLARQHGLDVHLLKVQMTDVNLHSTSPHSQNGSATLMN
jgi:UDP-GlcNAc:undecaprenyl-phosphate GlcNAc-1-phosphate transferase